MAPPALVVRTKGAVRTLRPDGSYVIGRDPTSIIKVRTPTLRIGRAQDNDIVLSDLIVSRHHAELRKIGDGCHEIVDLGGHNGTFVNGNRIISAVLKESDIVGIGRATFRLVGDELREFVDTGDVSLIAQNLTVRTPKGKVLRDHVSFPIPSRAAGDFVAKVRSCGRRTRRSARVEQPGSGYGRVVSMTEKSRRHHDTIIGR